MTARSRLSLARSPVTVVAVVLTLFFVVMAIVAPMLWSQAAENPDVQALSAPPSAEHLLGTDNLGRDVLLRVLVATRLSLVMALIGTLIGIVAGLLLGALPAVLGARTQRVFSTVINTWLAFPVLLVAMLVAILLSPSAQTAVIALGVTMTPSFARLAQTLSSRVGGSEYLAAARLLGVSRARQFLHYILPNIAEPIIVNVTISIGGGLLALSSLSFLGLGVQPPAYDWGRMLSDAFDQAYSAPIAVVGPGLAVVLAGLAFGLLGESIAAGLRDRGAAPSTARGLGPAPRVGPVATDTADPSSPVLDIRGLSVSFPGHDGWIRPVRDVSFSIGRGELVGVVGESGSGKSVTMMAAARLLGPEAAVTAQAHAFDGIDLRTLSEKDLRTTLGTGIAVVFQDSLTALNPAMRVGAQVAEVPRVHLGQGRREARRTAVEALDAVRIPDPERRAQQFPHEFSGGMRQRALVAVAQSGRPSLIIADEPTTALDVTVQRHVLALIRRECRDHGTAVIVVSHDIAVLAELCRRILVMYAGSIMEDVDVRYLADPSRLAHPYSRALAASLPDLDTDRTRPLGTIPGEPPEPSEEIVGCPFAARCAFATERCRTEAPPLVEHAHGGRVACWHPQDGVPIGEAERRPTVREAEA